MSLILINSWKQSAQRRDENFLWQFEWIYMSHCMNHRRQLNEKNATRREKHQRRVSNSPPNALIKVSSSKRFSFLWCFKYEMEKTCKTFSRLLSLWSSLEALFQNDYVLILIICDWQVGNREKNIIWHALHGEDARDLGKKHVWD